ncbi:MAG: CDP-alcohol phosphatidyltransferase family protein [Ruminococcaceae bacterium]|nr:CDP-alcohol phosphatidyltransferase family protein [Oscillospiraceae bacterium]
MKAKYIPNILSVLRLLMALSFAAVFILLPEKRWIAVVIFVVAGITDVVDGYLARRFGWITDAGKILDPLADKTMQVVALLCTVASGLVPIWLLIPIILKELTMGIGSLIFYKMFRTIGVSKNYGKAYTVLFYVAIAAIIVFDPWFSAHQWAKLVLCVATAISGWAAIVLYYITYLKGKLGRKNKPAHSEDAGA